MTMGHHQYSSLSSSETLDDLKEQHLLAEKAQLLHPYVSLIRRVILYCSGILLLLLGIVFGVFATLYVAQRPPSSDYVSLITSRSPITPDVRLSFHEQRFNGSLLKENVYRQPAGKEVDAAWQDLGIDYLSVVVPAGMASHVGLSQDQVKISEKYGGGFVANVEGLHHLHCLNLLRQSLWFNFDYYHAKGEGAFKNNDFVLQKHVSHCLDIIRQQLMCSVDIGVLGQVWWQSDKMEYPAAYVDFNTRHVCRNFDDVRAWAEKHQVLAEPPEDYLEPPKPGDKIYDSLP